MAIYIANKQDALVPDGEYTARIKAIKQTQNGENLIFRCELTTSGFENTIVPGFCGAHWRPTTRTTANLRQWCINLGVDVQKGNEADIDLESLAGTECRVIVQVYKSKAGEDKCKVSSILPLQKRLQQVAPTVSPAKGLYVGEKAPVRNTVSTGDASVSSESTAEEADTKNSAGPDLW